MRSADLTGVRLLRMQMQNAPVTLARFRVPDRTNNRIVERSLDLSPVTRHENMYLSFLLHLFLRSPMSVPSEAINDARNRMGRI